MKKLVLKTVAITFASVIVLLSVIYIFLGVFSPKTLAKCWADAGNYSVSVKYYEKQYKKTEDISDLAALCAKIDVKKDSARASKYLAVLTGSEGFIAFCDAEEIQDGYKMTSYEYYYGAYTVAEYYERDIMAAVEIAKRATATEYTQNNAFYILMQEADNLKEADGAIIAEAISAIKSEMSDATQISCAERDITLAQSIK